MRCRAQEALEEERTARVEAEALAARLRAQLDGLREAQTSQQRSAQERLSALQAHLQSLASRVVRPFLLQVLLNDGNCTLKKRRKKALACLM